MTALAGRRVLVLPDTSAFLWRNLLHGRNIASHPSYPEKYCFYAINCLATLIPFMTPYDTLVCYSNDSKFTLINFFDHIFPTAFSPNSTACCMYIRNCDLTCKFSHLKWVFFSLHHDDIWEQESLTCQAHHTCYLRAFTQLGPWNLYLNSRNRQGIKIQSEHAVCHGNLRVFQAAFTCVFTEHCRTDHARLLFLLWVSTMTSLWCHWCLVEGPWNRPKY